MNTSPKNDFPWELIAESLTGSITKEEELRLQQWLSSDPENNGKYLQIQELWKNGMNDYRYYKMANETESWKKLQIKLGKDHAENIKTGHILGQFRKRPDQLRRLLAIAALFIVIAGLGLWYMLAVNKPDVYETVKNEQREVALSDGSVISLLQNTRIEVPHDFNKSDRKIIMTSGDAFFEVVHNTDKPFIVTLGTTLIRDIGTSFSIHKEEKKIDVSVSSGKVAFVKITTQETRELSAGSGISFDVQNNSFGDIKPVESSEAVNLFLTFENTSLADVIISLQKIYGGKVIISDDITERKFTGQLYGMPYNSAIEVICKSLGLEYTLNDSIYNLVAKTTEQP